MLNVAPLDVPVSVDVAVATFERFGPPFEDSLRGKTGQNRAYRRVGNLATPIVETLEDVPSGSFAPLFQNSDCLTLERTEHTATTSVVSTVCRPDTHCVSSSDSPYIYREPT